MRDDRRRKSIGEAGAYFTSQQCTILDFLSPGTSTEEVEVAIARKRLLIQEKISSALKNKSGHTIPIVSITEAAQAFARKWGFPVAELLAFIENLEAAKAETTARETTGRATDEPRPGPADTARATPKASDGLEWPSETWKGSPEELSRKPHALIAYLGRVWKPFIDENNVIVTKSILKKRDPSVAAALKTYLQHVGELPDDIRIMSDDELKERIASHPVVLPRLAMQ